ncbi:type II toxin-antitoxin system death-on-curing family toxin [Kitasatospora sp. NBC_01539]|uniref:type II toxin-antitoxin system death-on-curing family toxin n=1 Tax=Kitasatospora sp. NBC_01539 TaxID=2903577 RepID=UPI00386022A5
MRYLDVPELLELAVLGCRGRPAEVREPGLLDSAAHRPGAEMFGVQAYDGLFPKAAALLHSLAANHPLVDGNKRTAWMGTVVFLDLNGADMADVDQDAAYALVVAVAAGEIADVGVIAERLRALHGGRA